MGIFKKKVEEPKFYDIEPLLNQNATYSISFGERSKGKTYSCLLHGLKMHVESGYTSSMAYVRRWADDFQGKRGSSLWEALVLNGEIEKYTNGEWQSVYYYSGRWYLCKWDENKKMIKADTPLCYAFGLNVYEHDKSSSYPSIEFIVFDEFISRQYLGDEFTLFLNVVSTIVRHRNTVRVVLLGNTINKYSNPYFAEMGIAKGVKKMKPGDLCIFKNDHNAMTIACEYTPSGAEDGGKESDIYFDFTDSSSANMIKSGAWEIGQYPRLPAGTRIRPSSIVFKYYIVLFEDIVEADVVLQDGNYFTFIHAKTTPIKDEDKDLVYSTEFDLRPNWRRDIMRPFDSLGQKVAYFFKSDCVYYQSNEIGEIVFNYINYFNT